LIPKSESSGERIRPCVSECNNRRETAAHSNLRETRRNARVTFDHAYPFIAEVRDVKIARRIDRNATRVIQPGGSSGTSVTVETLGSGSRNRVDYSSRCYHSYAPVAGVGDVEIARSVNLNVLRSSYLR
jgi:hypothetical protein